MSHSLTSNLNLADPTSSRFTKMRVQRRSRGRSRQSPPTHPITFPSNAKPNQVDAAGVSKEASSLPAKEPVDRHTFHWTFHHRFFGCMHAMWSRYVAIFIQSFLSSGTKYQVHFLARIPLPLSLPHNLLAVHLELPEHWVR